MDAEILIYLIYFTRSNWGSVCVVGRAIGHAQGSVSPPDIEMLYHT